MLKKLFVLSILLTLPSISMASIIKRDVPNINYVALAVFDGENNFNISAQLRLPSSPQESPMPAIVILHTTKGIDSTGAFYAQAFNRAGFATLELDMWGGRGIIGGATSRPPSPQFTVPDAFAALDYLAAREDIDADKIGVIGFSWGGVVSMLSATQAYQLPTQTGAKFAAHVANYPVCWLYNSVPGFEFTDLTGSPVLIQSAEWDDYDLPELCGNVVNNLTEEQQQYVKHKQYRRSYHTFDRLEPTVFFEDPAAFLGQGGTVKLSPNLRSAYRSRAKVTRFFSRAFANQ